MSSTTNLVRQGCLYFLAYGLPVGYPCADDCSTYSSQMEAGNKRNGSSSAPRTNAAIATVVPTKMLVPFRMALSRISLWITVLSQKQRGCIRCPF